MVPKIYRDLSAFGKNWDYHERHRLKQSRFRKSAVWISKFFSRNHARLIKYRISGNVHYDHWSVAVLTVTAHSSFFPTFDFFLNMLLSALDSIC